MEMQAGNGDAEGSRSLENSRAMLGNSDVDADEDMMELGYCKQHRTYANIGFHPKLTHHSSPATSDLTLRGDNQMAELEREKVQHCAGQSMVTLRLMEDVAGVLERQRCVSDAKLLMFAAAAHSEGYRSTLVPVPLLFMGETFYEIERLRRIVASWPSCSQMLDMLTGADRFKRLAEMDASDGGDIHLLHWVLVWQAFPDLRRVCTRRLYRLCRKWHLPPPAPSPDQVLRVSYKTEANPPPKAHNPHAYLGCPLSMLYRLLIMRDLPGPMQLYERPDPALAQCTDTPGTGWTHSRFGRAPRCLLICELLERRPQAPFVVHDPSGLRVRYLLLYTDLNQTTMEFASSLASRTDGVIHTEARAKTEPNSETKTEPKTETKTKAKTKAKTNIRSAGDIARWLLRRACNCCAPRQSTMYC